MYSSEDDLKALLGVEAESVSLEFKDGTKLNELSSSAKKDLVIDVTAMANSGGGTIIYGIAEGPKQAGRSVAGAISPVTDERVTQDRLRETVYSNTDPALSNFAIRCIPVGGGRVFVVEVEQGDTAYQNKIDRLFYNRVDASSVPMYGFAIRDVMNRRSTPHVVARLRMTYPLVESAKHRYQVIPELYNEGNLTANHWTLQIGLPAVIGRMAMSVNSRIGPLGERIVDGRRTVWFEASSERMPNARLLPGEERTLGPNLGCPELLLQIESQDEVRILQTAPPLHWTLFVDNAPRRTGEVPFESWCRW